MEDALNFERVTLDEARQVLDTIPGLYEAPAPGEESAPPPVKYQRRAPRPEDSSPDPKTYAWIARLPARVRPTQLVLRFPRVANNIAAMWRTPTRCEAYIHDLLFPARQGRQGFPPDVAREIGLLFDYFQNEVYPQPFNPWSCGREK